MKFLGLRQGLVCAILTTLSPQAARNAAAAEDGLALRSMLPPGSQHNALRRAVMGARLRLLRPECQRVFAEFKDGSGRTLQENLEAQERDAAAYLTLILFADGSRQRVCRNGNIFAATQPGSRVVYVCGQQFAQVDASNPSQTETFLIHEALHSLGLGENPPTPKEINDRVSARCHP